MSDQPSVKLLIPEPPLQVLPSLAVKLGLNEAIFVQELHYMLINPKLGKVINGRKWIFCTLEEWHEIFPFWAVNTISNIIAKLVEAKTVMEDNFNETLSRRKWYSIDYETLKDAKIKKPRKKRADYANFGDTMKTRKKGTKGIPAVSPNFGSSNIQTLDVESSKDSSKDSKIPPEIGISGSTPKPEQTKFTPVEKGLQKQMGKSGIAIAHNEAERQAELALIEKGVAKPIGSIRGVKPAKDKPLTLTGASFLQVWVNTIGKDRFPRTMNYKVLGGAAKKLIATNPTLNAQDIEAAAKLFKSYLDGLNGSCPILEWNPAQFVSFFKLADDMHHQTITPAMVKWYVEEEKKSAFWVGKTISFQHVATNVQSAVKERKPNLNVQPTTPKPICTKCDGQGWIPVFDANGKMFGQPCECQKEEKHG